MKCKLPLALIAAFGPLTTPAAGWAQAAPDAPPAEELPADAPITKLPSVKTFVEAVYPKAALRERVSAKVSLEIDIGTDGSVEGVDVVGSSTVAATATSSIAGLTASSTITDYGFEAAAIAAARQLVFEPAESNGTPIPVRIGYAFNFAPPPLPPPPPPSSTASAAQAPAKPGIMNFTGQIRERGTRVLLSGVIVTVFRQIGDEVIAYEATTNEEGTFEFFDLDPGAWKVQADLDGYYPVRDAEKIEPDQITDVTYFMEKGDYNPYEVVVRGQRVIKEVNRRTLTREEILKVPGTLGDPVTVIQNLPGVARAPGLSGLIIVRGSGPQDTGIFIEGIEVPLIYHFGGLKSVIPASVIETVDFYPGNYSVYYGRATGGIFDAHIKRIEPDQVHGSLDVSVLDTSLFVEVPITDEFAIAVGGRRSYVDVILNAVVPDDSDVALTSAPVYYDYQVLANWRPAPAHEVRALFLGSDDSIELLFENPSDFDAQITGTDLSASTSFQRGIFEYRYVPSTRFKNEARFAIGNDKIDFNLGEQFFFNLDVLGIQFRNNAEYMPNDWISLNAGVDAIFQIADVQVQAPGGQPREGQVGGNDDLSETISSEVEGAFFGTISPYVEAKIDLFDDRLSVVPGLRMDWWSETKSVTFDPRVTMRYSITKQWFAKAGVGLVHQAPQPAEFDENFGNPDLDIQRAVQYSVGGEWIPNDYLSVDLTFFVKDLQNLVSNTSAVRDDGSQLNLDNGGTGTVIGLELFAEHKFHDNFRGWLSYTLSKATRIDSGKTESRLFDFDQTHILTLVASYILPENWEVGVRWRLVSGSPNTPFDGGVYLSDFDRYSPIPGPTNSERLPTFHQLDLRVDKTWIFDFWQLSAYLSLLNTYNRGNVEGWSYNFDFTDREGVTGLPLIPILGIKGTF